MIIDHLTQNGVMEPALLFDSPYTNYNPNGLAGLFADGDAERIVRTLQLIKSNAVAA
jgi:type I restriction enzyme R subunit